MSEDLRPILSDLTPPELELLACARRGVTAQVSQLPVHLVAVSGPEVRGRFVRELLLGRHGELDPRGVRLAGARITGKLDLAYVKAQTGLYLVRCAIGGSFSAVDARLENLACTNCRLRHLHADRIRIDHVLDLARTQVTGTRSPLRLRSAHLGALDCAGLVVRSSDNAIAADRLQVDGDFLLDRAHIRSAGDLGALRMPDAHVGGQLSAIAAHLSNSSGPAVQADGLRVGSNLFLTDARLEGAGQLGAVRLLEAQIGGQAQFEDARVSNRSGPAVAVDKMQAAGLYLTKAQITGTGANGALRLSGAQITGQLHGQALEVANSSGPAISADGLQVGTELYLQDARLTGAGEAGTLRLLGASIGAQLSAGGIRVDNDSGPGLVADGIEVRQNMSLARASITGTGSLCAVRLLGARIGSQLSCVELRARNRSGPALAADSLVVGNSLSFKSARIDGASEHGALILHSAKLSGQLNLTARWVRNTHRVAVNLTNAQAEGQVFLPSRLVCPQPWGRSCRWSTGIRLESFTFESLVSPSWREWLHLIRFHTPRYAPSPYQKLAAAERAAGHDGNARHILIAQQQDLQRRDSAALGGRLTRFFHRSWGVLAGYGYRARRTAAALMVALIAAITVGVLAGHITDGTHHAAERVASFNQTVGQPCTPVELIGVGLDRGLPLSPTGVRTRCDLNTETTAGQWLTLLIWLIQGAVWGLATLALAGYTGLIRKPA